jgi:hypothetical protein
MKALVVYESMFGNTEKIARAVADGVGEAMDVQLAEVADAPTEPSPDVALIVAGGPTHAFSMSRENTRADAISKGAHEGEREFGLVSGWRRCRLANTPRSWPPSIPRSKVCATCPDQPPRAPLRPRTGMATGRCPKRKTSMSMMSTVRFSTVRLIGRELGVGSSPRR